jgi:uncharacterized protein YigA (DUF484 family)
VPQGEHELWEYAARNRADIDTALREIDRLRERTHDLASSVAGFRHLANAVDHMADELHGVTQRLDTISRRAVEKPTVPTVAVLLQLATVAVAVIALIVASRH